jgi:4-amino-4-deoxy-L-arabinose transferase-like glycosyltransferase
MAAIKSDKNPLLLFSISLAVRLLIFFVFYNHVTIYPDSSGYLDLAGRLINFDLSGYEGFRSPGYPLLLALASNNTFIIVLIQFLLGSISSVFWYLSLKNFNFPKRLSFLIAMCTALLLNVIFFETAVLVEGLTLFWMAILVYILSRGYFKKSNIKTEIILSVLLGVLVLIKPFYAFLPFLIYGIYLLKNWKFKTLFSKKLIIFICPLIAYFGWSYVNKINTGHFVSTTYFGLNTAQNVVRFAEKTPEKYNWISEPYVHYREKAKRKNSNIAMSIWAAYNAGAFSEKDLDFPDLSAEMGKFARAAIKENPSDYLNQVIFYSFVNFWKPTIMWNYNSFDIEKSNKAFVLIWRIQFYLLFAVRLLFLIVTPFIIFKAIKKHRISILFTLATIIWTTSILQAVVTYGSNARFSFPFEFMMIFVVAFYMFEFYERQIKPKLTRQNT